MPPKRRRQVAKKQIKKKSIKKVIRKVAQPRRQQPQPRRLPRSLAKSKPKKPAQVVVEPDVTVNPKRALRGRGKAIRPAVFKDPQHRYQQRQIFPKNTWLLDLVCMNDKEAKVKYWYVFFVEANTRYLIVLPANGFYNSGAWEQNVTRINESNFLRIFKAFRELNFITKPHNRRSAVQKKPVFKIIADSEKAFWAKNALDYYKKEKIKLGKVNVRREGHTRMSILDRVVRTIRGLLLSLNSSRKKGGVRKLTREERENLLNNWQEDDSLERRVPKNYIPPTPDVLLQLATLYNNHNNKALGGFTPKQAHNNPLFERRLNIRRLTDNFLRTRAAGTILDEDAEVDVRANNTGLFDKENLGIEPETYQVLKRLDGGLYRLLGTETGKRISRYRKDLRPV